MNRKQMIQRQQELLNTAKAAETDRRFTCRGRRRRRTGGTGGNRQRRQR